jgi:hypothetical protein
VPGDGADRRRAYIDETDTRSVVARLGGEHESMLDVKQRCPDADGWPAVTALIKPIAVPEKKSIAR